MQNLGVKKIVTKAFIVILKIISRLNTITPIALITRIIKISFFCLKINLIKSIIKSEKPRI